MNQLLRNDAVDLDAVLVPERLRPLDPAHVEQISASMAEIGQQQPIAVVERLDDRDGEVRLVLVAGYHRLAAAQRLGWDTIDACVIDASPAEARIIEIDENLCRRELSMLDRALFMAERKRIWEELHPETAHGKAKKPKDGKVANLATFARFSKEAAKKTGLSERAIRRATSLASRLFPEARDLLRLSPLADNQGQLELLAQLPAEEQIAVARALVEGKAKTIAAARVAAGLVPAPRAEDPLEAQKKRFLSDWSRMSHEMKTFISCIADNWRKGQEKPLSDAANSPAALATAASDEAA